MNSDLAGHWGAPRPCPTPRTGWRQVARLLGALFFAAAVVACGGGDSSAGKWVAAWYTSPEPADIQILGVTARPFNNETLRQTAIVTASGKSLRVRLSNRYGATAMQIGGIRIARAGAAGSIASGTDKPLLFSGSEAVSIAPLSEVVSGPVPFDVAAGDQLSISLYMPGSVPTPTWHWTAIQTSYIAPGNQLSAQTLVNPSTSTSFHVLTGVDVESSAAQRTIALIGDSLTDGVGSSLDAQKRYPDALFARLQAAGKGMSVVNAGIATNRLLHDIVAPSLLKRLDADALDAPGVSHVAVLVGVNDLGVPGWLNRPGEVVTAEQLIGGLTEVARRAHAKNQKAFVATITPFNGFAAPGYYSDAAEAKRQVVNAWIRTNTVFDGVFDFDAVVRDPNDISKIRAAFDSGDHLHPNDLGYAAMANSIDLNRF